MRRAFVASPPSRAYRTREAALSCACAPIALPCCGATCARVHEYPASGCVLVEKCSSCRALDSAGLHDTPPPAFGENYAMQPHR
ncbi:hypothetical protein FH972_025501 [Carpinus fangiana]|uniref:Uncharacterized protein n=1 Tax=Carpinus fangiana TaxID=176857 RepID=A0A5N6L167_9ROSI|nr:hypothetical protein FH972_025501 [Carpinus fangiana]